MFLKDRSIAGQIQDFQINCLLIRSFRNVSQSSSVDSTKIRKLNLAGLNVAKWFQLGFTLQRFLLRLAVLGRLIEASGHIAMSVKPD